MMTQNITVIIPALNEEKTIASVINLALQSPNVTEVLVIDDCSTDATAAIARSCGARVITSKQRGKGISMQEGMEFASNNVLVYLDADIETYSEDTIKKLCEPILEGRFDFVKSYFQRQAGRVTELVAKPLLSILYPGFPKFQQPLSGMIAGRKEYFEKCNFENGYGVDIGILIDMFHLNARICEVNIGNIENRMHPLEALAKMSKEVAKTIIQKVKDQTLHTYERITELGGQMGKLLHLDSASTKKIALFDMDNTILRGSFIRTAALELGFEDQLAEVMHASSNPMVRTKNIARLLKGFHINELITVFDKMSITANFDSLMVELKQKGYLTGIISDSYSFLTHLLTKRFGLDLHFANDLEFNGGICTGEVRIPSYFFKASEKQCTHEYCKSHILSCLKAEHQITSKNIIMIGDGENDECIIKKVGYGVSFCSTSAELDKEADMTVKTPDFNLLRRIFK